jgi:dTDP-4-amino-4,6-dideoxygalactose transaminase
MITHAGANVVFCDTDASTFTIDPAAIESAITPRTVGIVPVHLYGQPADMDAIMEIARRRKLWVIEDCAQAHLAQYAGQQVGTFGDAATYSFYPGKNLGAMGDAGAIVTGRSDLAERMAMLARHGGLVKHQHRIEGINSRLDGLQAAVLSAKLPHLTRWTQARQAAAAEYDVGLNQIEEVVVPQVATGRTHVYHLYTIQHPERDRLAAHLNANGVQTAINYPVALPFVEAYGRLDHRPEQFPNAHRHQGRILSLPMFAEITAQQQKTVVDLIRSFG